MKTITEEKTAVLAGKKESFNPKPIGEKILNEETKIKRILVPVDFSETSEFATFRAASMAALMHSDLYLIHVIDYKNTYFTIVPEAQDSRPPMIEIQQFVNEKLNAIRVMIHQQTGLNSHMFITEGSIDSEIRKFAEKSNIDLIVMGTHGVSGYKEIFLGSNAQRVVTLSDVPVLTMKKENSYSEFKNILLPFDDSSHSREKVNIASEIAEIYGSEVHIVGLPETDDEAELKAFRIKLESVEKILHKKKIPFKTEIINDDNIAKAALDYADKYKCDLIVINTGHESKLTGVFLGAFAQQIVNHSKIPVLSVKPRKDSVIITAPGYGIS